MALLMLQSCPAEEPVYARKVQTHKFIENSVVDASMDVENRNERIWLYYALCIKRPILLHGLVEVFSKCDEPMREHIVSTVEQS